jgi:hypothetical protein
MGMSAFVVFFVVTEEWPMVVLGVAGVGCFGWLFFKALRDPTFPKPPSS